jgi:hypothetical protein
LDESDLRVLGCVGIGGDELLVLGGPEATPVTPG